MGSNIRKFLAHKTQERSGGFLKDWKDKGKLDNWLHTKHVPECVWTHSWPTVVAREDKDTKEVIRHVWSKSYVCPEPENVLKKQYFRDKETGLLKLAPRYCGLCRFLDWVYMQILTGKLKIEQPLFKMSGDIEKETALLHAGGLCNQLKADKLSDGAKSRVAKAGISLRESFKENVMARAQYIAVIVDDNDPGAGAQIATIASSLGDKIKDVIAESMDNAEETKGNADLGDPLTHPFLFRWIYDEKEEDLNKKYKVRKIEKKPSDAIREIIFSDEIDLSNQFAPMDQKTMRALMEKACLLKGKDAPPWDELFSVATPKAAARSKPVDEPEEETEEETEPKDDDLPASYGKKPKTDEPDDDDEAKPLTDEERDSLRGMPREEVAELVESGKIIEDDLYECGECHKGSPLPEVCVHCGAEFDDEGNVKPKAPPPPPPKAMRTRGAKPKDEEVEEPQPKTKPRRPGF
jgi:hypothetical protein